MIEQLEEYAKHLNANAEVMAWLRTTGAKALKSPAQTVSSIEHILDFLVSPAAPTRLQKMSIADAERKAAEWSKANQKKGRDLVDSAEDIETIHDFGDGTKIVRLKTKKAFQREGFFMSHCAGGYNPDNANCHIYSYRDKDNEPHATFEVQKQNNEIIQIKGKGNGPIHPKYIHPILAFLKTIGMEVRPNDMVNLGYHHIHKDHTEFLKRIPGAWEQVAEINGEIYAF
jgi:hypothetical protein